MSYSIIYADPPWSFGSSAYQDGGRKGVPVDYHYPVMDTKDICLLPIKDIADQNSALFIWTTDAHLPDCLQVMKAWGFEYRTVAFVWVKRYSSGKPCVLVAPWTLKSTELCLLGIRGSPKRVVTNIRALVEAERTKHSKKPDEVRQRIERMFGDVSRVELFARSQTQGWDVFGNEVEGSIRLLTQRAVDVAVRCKKCGDIASSHPRAGCSAFTPRN